MDTETFTLKWPYMTGLRPAALIDLPPPPYPTLPYYPTTPYSKIGPYMNEFIMFDNTRFRENPGGLGLGVNPNLKTTSMRLVV